MGGVPPPPLITPHAPHPPPLFETPHTVAGRVPPRHASEAPRLGHAPTAVVTRARKCTKKRRKKPETTNKPAASQFCDMEKRTIKLFCCLGQQSQDNNLDNKPALKSSNEDEDISAAREEGHDRGYSIKCVVVIRPVSGKSDF